MQKQEFKSKMIQLVAITIRPLKRHRIRILHDIAIDSLEQDTSLPY